MHRFPAIYCVVIFSVLLGVSSNAAAPDSGTDMAHSAADAVSALNSRVIDARDLKTLHYMENAHGQLEQWSQRLLSRLEHGMGPRAKDPILDGRADLQVQKIAITYASYTRNEALNDTLQHLAKAHRARLTALQTMVAQGPDRKAFDGLSAPLTEIVTELRTWSKKR